MMTKETFTAMIGTGLSAIGTGMQTNEVLEMISLIITIVGAVLTLAMSLYTWYKNAKADGKITKDELKDASKIVQNSFDEINDALNKDKENKKDENK